MERTSKGYLRKLATNAAKVLGAEAGLDVVRRSSGYCLESGTARGMHTIVEGKTAREMESFLDGVLYAGRKMRS